MPDVLDDTRDRSNTGRPRVTADYGGRRKIFERRKDLLSADNADRRSGNDRRSGFDRRSTVGESKTVTIDEERRTNPPEDNSEIL